MVVGGWVHARLRRILQRHGIRPVLSVLLAQGDLEHELLSAKGARLRRCAVDVGAKHGLRATWHVAVHASLHHRHFPFGPRGSRVSGRHLHATYRRRRYDLRERVVQLRMSGLLLLARLESRYRPKGRPLGAVRPPAPPCCFPCVCPQHSRALG